VSNTPIRTVTVKPLALKQEQGRRRNNKSRPAGEKVRTKAYYLAAFSKSEMDALVAGETVTKTYKSGRTESYVLAK
jgi:hypothetical protein